MCLCTFISVLEWHFHCNYWANQLTSDGSVLACSLSLGNISFCFFFFFFFIVSVENGGMYVEISSLAGMLCAFVCCQWSWCVCGVDCWFVETLAPLSWNIIIMTFCFCRTEYNADWQQSGEMDRIAFTGWWGGGKEKRERTEWLGRVPNKDK